MTHIRADLPEKIAVEIRGLLERIEADSTRQMSTVQ
jgi:hypothetical protein